MARRGAVCVAGRQYLIELGTTGACWELQGLVVLGTTGANWDSSCWELQERETRGLMIFRLATIHKQRTILKSGRTSSSRLFPNVQTEDVRHLNEAAL